MKKKTPKHLRLLGPLLRKPFFTSAEARKKGASPACLNYYVKIGRLKQVHRGVYQSVNYENMAGIPWEDLVEATYTVKNGIICLISALSIYDLTEEIPWKHWIAVSNSTSVKASNTERIIRFRDVDLGKTTIMLAGMKVPIFDRERTIIDTFRLLSRETAIKALKMGIVMGGKNRLDLIKLENYAKKLRFDIMPYLMTATT